MARQESDREDMMREATALVRRAEWQSPAGNPVLFAGFRRDQSASLYFGGDPVYHFNAQGCLRRAYRSGRLYRTQGTTLAELARHRTEMETKLVRSDLTEQQRDDFLAEMAERIEQWRQDVNDRRAIISQVYPSNDTDIENDFAMAIQRILDNAAQKTLAPRVRGKR